MYYTDLRINWFSYVLCNLLFSYCLRLLTFLNWNAGDKVCISGHKFNIFQLLSINSFYIECVFYVIQGEYVVVWGVLKTIPSSNHKKNCKWW